MYKSNIAPPPGVHSGSFLLPEATAKRLAPTKAVGSKKKKKAVGTRSNKQQNLLTLQSSALRPEEGPSIINRTEENANLLQGRTIYIEKKLIQYNKLKEMASVMGATVKDSLDSSVTDYITDLKSGKKHLGRTSNKGIRCVSPLWIITCYEQNEYLPSINFPIDLKTHINTLSTVGHSKQAPQSTEINLDDATDTSINDDNPFGLEAVDYDFLEANKPGKQMKMDRFVTKTANSSARNSNNSDQIYNMSDVESVRLPVGVSSVSDEDERRKEFFYNNNGSDSSVKAIKKVETAEEIEARKNRRDEIRAKLEKAKSSASSRVTRSSSQLPLSTGVFGQDKFKVWYGEQEFKHQTPNK